MKDLLAYAPNASVFVTFIVACFSVPFAIAAHRILTARFRREEEEREIARKKDDLLRDAHEQAHRARTAATLLMIPIKLRSERDRKAAWALQKEGLATLNGDRCVIPVNTLPPFVQAFLDRR